jgi:hypothetical protein
MKDPRWHASEGWVKMKQTVNGTKIPLRVPAKWIADDFEFKTPIRVAAIAAIAIGGIAGILAMQSNFADCGSQVNVKNWNTARSTDGDAPTDRQKIADEVVRCESLDGMRKADVRRLLGPPMDDIVDKRVGFRGYRYVIGEGRGISAADPEYLVVEFTPAGVVSRVSKADG